MKYPKRFLLKYNLQNSRKLSELAVYYEVNRSQMLRNLISKEYKRLHGEA